MKIIDVTDVHGNTDFLREIHDPINGADLVLVSGDITHFGGRLEAGRVIAALQTMNSRVFAVPGNCDRAGVEEFLTEEGINLNARAVQFGEVTLYGMGGSLPCPGATPNEHSEEEFAILLDGLKTWTVRPGPSIFVSHQPPFDTVCDRAHSGGHVGSKSIRRFIEEVQPSICFTGHIHEASGVDYIGKTVVVNPGPLRTGGYAELRLETDPAESLSLKVKNGARIIANIG
jgi:Icc-related predicted phosphoesterase